MEQQLTSRRSLSREFDKALARLDEWFQSQETVVIRPQGKGTAALRRLLTGEGASPSLPLISGEGRKSEDAIYSWILENMEEAVHVFDSHGNIGFTNLAFDSLFGYGRGRLIGRHLSILNNHSLEENTRLTEKIIEEAHREGVWEGTFANRHRDGTIFFTKGFVYPLEIWGRRYWVAVQHEDFASERACVKTPSLEDQGLQDLILEKLRGEGDTARRGFESYLDGIPQGIIIAAPGGEIVGLNRVARRVYGLPGGEEEGRSLDGLSQILELSTPEGELIPESEWPINRVLRGERLTCLTARVRRLDANHIWTATYSGVPVFGKRGEVVLGVLIMRDLSEEWEGVRPAASREGIPTSLLAGAAARSTVPEEDRWNESMARLCRRHTDDGVRLSTGSAGDAAGAVHPRGASGDVAGKDLVLESLPAAVIVIDRNRCVVTANRAAEQLFGRRFLPGDPFPGEGMPFLCYPGGIPYDPRCLPLSRSADTLEKSINMKMVLITPEGEHRDLLANTAPVLDEDGDVVAAVGVFQDVTGMEQATMARWWSIFHEAHDAEHH
jgi:PAS domain S-box-containing protein